MNLPLGKIAVVGSGAVGLYYGGHLAASGADVRFLMRSGLPAARSNGIHIRSDSHPPIHIPEPRVFDSAAAIGPADWILIALKATSNPSLESLLPPLLKPGTLLLTLQNGLGNEEFLADRWGAHRVLGGLCFVCLNRLEPATVHHMGHGRLAIGEFGGGSAGAADMAVSAFRAANIPADATPHLLSERWRKLVWNVPFNALTLTEGCHTVDRILSHPALLAQARGLMDEILAIAHAEGCEIGSGLAQTMLENTRSMGQYKPSTVIDFLAGRQLEIEPIWGVPLRRAAARNVPVPLLQDLYSRLLEISPPAINAR